MRMKESGIGTTAIVVIIVAVVIGTVIPVTVVAVLLGGGAPGGLPVYSGASYFNGTTAGSTTLSYYDLGSADLATVYNWYKTEMPNQGWTLTVDNPQTGAYTIDYTKGSDSAEIVIVAGTIEGYSASHILVLSYTPGTPSGGTTGATT
jgi:hypothetical protein